MQNGNALAVRTIGIDELIPYARNARTHSEEQIAQIAASIREFGFTNPVLIDPEGGIIAGHGRVMAARKLGLTELPSIELGHLTKAQRQAYVIADNKLALNAGWDLETLRAELDDLDALDFDLPLLGFDDEELAGIRDRYEGQTDPDEAPELPEEPRTRPGDLWLCGRHRVLCGDATSAADVERLLAGVTPLLMVTDPPYGVEYDPDWRNRVDRANGKPYGGRAVGRVVNDDRTDWSGAWALFPGDAVYCWSPPGTNQMDFHKSLTMSGFQVRMQIIWAKSRMIIGRGHYHVQHEPCWYAVRKGGKGHWSGDRTQTTLWSIDHLKSDTGHSTQKPVECMRRPIVNNSAPGQPVYDPFLGSGTTMIAAEMEARACYGLEISPAYVDVIVERWQNFTGEKATRDSEEIRAPQGADPGAAQEEAGA